MTKKEIIWRHILFQNNKRNNRFTQKELAQKYGFSLSTVFNALKSLRKANIIEGQRGFKVIDMEKLLYFWATHRNLKKDILFQTHVDKKVQQIQGEMPAKAIFGAYTAFSKKYEIPADYDKVYVYLEKQDIQEIKNRFPCNKGYINLIVLQADPWLKQFNGITPDVQTFVDLWNLGEWYAKDFLSALKEKIIHA